MAEYIFTNLPQYIRVTPRTDFANSVVQANHVLLFSEDGETLTAKLPDGSFITVGGGGGTDVSDTTATAATVLAGYDFYNSSGVKTSGSIQTVTASASGNVVTVPAGYIASSQTLTIGTAVAAQTITPGTTDQTIAAGSYLTGAATIKGDANLIAANIADGVTIFGVTGTHQGGGGGSTDFYKCASVDTVNLTWTGYKAVFDAVTGIYSYEATATSGLTYSVITPVVGKVYADGALVVVSDLFGIIPDDMVLYVPLSSSSATAETGQSLTFGGTGFNFSTVDGIPCCYFSGAGYIDVSTQNIPSSGNFTISHWVKFSGSEWGIIYTQPGINTSADATALSFGDYSPWGIGATTNTANWHHFAVTRDGDTITVYLDGALVDSDNRSISPGSTICRLGAHNDYSDAYPFVGYLAGLRVYNRALSAAEIAALAAEFTPSV